MMSSTVPALQRRESPADPLPLPSVIVPRQTPGRHYAQVEFELQTGNFPNPTIEARRNQVVYVHWRDAMAKDSPLLKDRVETGIYDNRQRAAQGGYDGHALDITRLNVPTGVAGLWFIRDSDDDAVLRSVARTRPAGYRSVKPDEVEPGTPLAQVLEIPILLKEGGAGSMVNGVRFPFAEVAALPYRLRILNGAIARYARLFITNESGRCIPFAELGGAEGLLDHAMESRMISLAPGKPADLVIDFQARPGQTLTLRNSNEERLLEFRIGPPVSGAKAWLPPQPLSSGDAAHGADQR
jgi:spore coat protein A